MRPVFEARAAPRPARIVYAEGEDERVLRAVQSAGGRRPGAADPDRPARRDRARACASSACAWTWQRACACSTRRQDEDGVRAADRPRTSSWSARRGVPPEAAARRVRHARRPSRPPAAAGGRGRCGDLRRQRRLVAAHAATSCRSSRKRPEVSRIYALSGLILPAGALFICDTHMNVDPTAEQIAEMTLLAAEAVRGFGLQPKAALLSHSSFGASNSPTRAQDAPGAGADPRARAPELEVDGEMHADAALARRSAHRAVPDSRADRRGQPAGHARPRRRQHRLQPAEGGGRRRCRWGRCCWAWPSRSSVVPPA